MLNQAPILGKYALREMEEKGVSMDIREWFKDKNHIFSALKAYELDVATNAGMQARGRIALAQQDMWAKIAGNNDVWRYFGNAGVGLIGSFGSAVNSLLTTLTNNQAFMVMVKRVEHTFDAVAASVDNWLPKILELVEKISEKMGVKFSDPTQAKKEVDRARAIKYFTEHPEIYEHMKVAMHEFDMFKNVKEGYEDKAIKENLALFYNYAVADSTLNSKIKSVEKLTQIEDLNPSKTYYPITVGLGGSATNVVDAMLDRSILNRQAAERIKTDTLDSNIIRWYAPVNQNRITGRTDN